MRFHTGNAFFCYHFFLKTQKQKGTDLENLQENNEKHDDLLLHKRTLTIL